MKELSIEEKAKAYDEVREKIAIRFGSNVAEEIFSEYEESEDEKVIKFITNELACLRAIEITGSNRYEELTNAIAWLEKQDEYAVACSEGQMKMLNEVLNFAANHENPY